ncbi:MAG TPA: hypothetical protein VH082_08165 [Rudaea sp.]|nr:hypothetical protein [Rudaea sp.]
MRSIVSLGLILVASSAFANECAFQEPRNLDIDAGGVRTLEARLGSTDLRVVGDPSVKRVEVRGRACASAQNRLAEVSLEQRRDGDTLVLTPHSADQMNIGPFGSNYAYLDVEVRIPQSVAVRIRSASGDVDAKHVSSLDFTSNSGDLVVDGVDGELRAEVHSGDVKAHELGQLDVARSGSGDVVATKVRDDVHVGHVGSGDLNFSDVGKGVHVESIGSGDVTVRHAGGSLVIDSIGSGDVNGNDIGGDFIVKSAGSGDIHHGTVHGKISVPHDNDSDNDNDNDD